LVDIPNKALDMCTYAWDTNTTDEICP
jgi:hypothetical protein